MEDQEHIKRSITGESAEASVDTDKSWRERLIEILKGYEAKDIWNLDETGCFWRALPNKGLGKFKGECKGGEKSKHRVTIAFFVNAAGESEHLPVVIWKSCNPRCFKGVKKESLPVCYYSQPKPWMTGRNSTRHTEQAESQGDGKESLNSAHN